ncbi:T9SS type A sorting domain-containing protein [bacterium]|nr:T9SS type A sorting domain-containing protein [bacterium]
MRISFPTFILLFTIISAFNTTSSARVVYKSHRFPYRLPFNENLIGYSFDINDDGLLDLYTQSYFNRFFLNTGNGGFDLFSPTEREVRRIVCEDMNQDGTQDFVIVAGNSQLYILEHDGEMNFTEVSLQDIPVNLVYAGDFTSDGLPDLLTYYGGNYPTLMLWENTGNLQFTREIVMTGNNTPKYLELVDFNFDQILDFVCYADSSTLSWWEGSGSGEFTEHTIVDTLSNTRGSISFDVDHDGDTDIFTCYHDFEGLILYKWLNSGDDEFFTPEFVDTTYVPIDPGLISTFQRFKLADMDGDNNLDLLVGNHRWSDWGISIGNLAIYSFDQFGEVVNKDVIVHDGVEFAFTGNINNRRGTDIFCTMPGWNTLVNYIAWFEGTETDYSKRNLQSHHKYNYLPALIDYDDDGDLDILNHNGMGGYRNPLNNLVLRLNNGRGGFDSPMVLNDSIGRVSKISIIDFDTDGDTDFFTSNGPQIYFWENISAGEYEQNEIGLSVAPIELTDLDQDGDFDIIGRANPDGEGYGLVWWEQMVSGELSEPQMLCRDTWNAEGFIAFDIDFDGDVDVMSSFRHNFFWYRQLEPLQFEIVFYDEFPGLHYPSFNVAVADIDYDGDIDIYNQGNLFLNEGEGEFRIIEINPYQEELHVSGAAEIVDLDRDGDLDLIGKYAEAVAWYENDGNLNFETHILDNDKLKSVVVGNIDTDPEVEIIGVSGYTPGILIYDVNPQVNVSEKISKNIPNDLLLTPPYPNPFNSTLRATFTLPQKGDVSIHLFDILGRDVGKVVQGTFQPGKHHFYLDAKGLASGTYFLRAETENGLQTSQKVILLR